MLENDRGSELVFHPPLHVALNIRLGQTGKGIHSSHVVVAVICFRLNPRQVLVDRQVLDKLDPFLGRIDDFQDSFWIGVEHRGVDQELGGAVGGLAVLDPGDVGTVEPMLGQGTAKRQFLLAKPL